MVRTCKRIKTKLQKKTLGVLYRTRHFLNDKALYLIFNSLLMSQGRVLTGFLFPVNPMKKKKKREKKSFLEYH